MAQALTFDFQTAIVNTCDDNTGNPAENERGNDAKKRFEQRHMLPEHGFNIKAVKQAVEEDHRGAARHRCHGDNAANVKDNADHSGPKPETKRRQ